MIDTRQAHMPANPFTTLVLASLRYAGLIFVLGFLLGTLRLIVTAPMIGETAALVIELPLMLLASLAVARHSLTVHQILTPGRAALMGLCAFVLLMIAEAALALILNGEMPGRWAASLVRWPGSMGFAAQIAFALAPPALAAGARASRAFRR